MLRKAFVLTLSGIATLAVLACVTINVYFPEAAVKDLSEKIEDAVAREAEEASADEPESGGGAAPGARPSLRAGSDWPRLGRAAGPVGLGQNLEPSARDSGAEDVSWLRSTFDRAVGTTLHLLAPAPVYAQTDEVAAPEITNPAIRKIIQSRATRVRDLGRHKAAGAVGENNRALVEVRQLDALALQERAAVQKLVRAENADRERMFKEIAAATGTDLSQLPKIRGTYATTLRQKARRGDWIQMPDGSWRQK